MVGLEPTTYTEERRKYRIERRKRIETWIGRVILAVGVTYFAIHIVIFLKGV